MTNKLQITHVAVDMLSPNPWNTNQITDPANEEKLKSSLRRFGFTKPIIVRTLDDGALQIIGGEHRWKAARDLGITEVPVVNLGPLDDRRAKEIGLVDNGRYGEDDTLGLSNLLRELGNDVLEFMPYSEAEFQSILNTSSVVLDDLDSLERTELPRLDDLPAAPSHQLMKFKVPVADVAWMTALIERTMKREGFTTEDSLSNAGNAMVVILKAYENAP